KHGKRTLADGLHLQAKFLRELGVDLDAVSFAGGAGGANADSTTPRATVTLLRALAKRPEYPALEAGLPVLGVDGTLATAVPAESPARGQVRAKTGTLSWGDVLNERGLLRSTALAGTMTTAPGQPRPAVPGPLPRRHRAARQVRRVVGAPPRGRRRADHARPGSAAVRRLPRPSRLARLRAVRRRLRRRPPRRVPAAGRVDLVA